MHHQAIVPSFPFARPGLAPPIEYAHFRQEPGLGKVRLWDGSIVWLATRYDDVRNILADNRFSADGRKDGYPAISPGRSEVVKTQPPIMIRMDPPDHGRHRKMLAREFAHYKIQALRPMAEKVVNDLVDSLLEHEKPADFFKHFALALPSIVIAHIIGVPYEHHEFFQERASTKVNLDSAPEDAVRANQELLAFLHDLFKDKARNADKNDDIISHLLIEQIGPGHLSIDEAVGMMELLLMAGHETTANMSALGTLAILQDPEALEIFRAGPPQNVVMQAVEEMLRYFSIVHFTGTRVAMEDVEISGEVIRKGEGVLAMIAGANHDTARFEKAGDLDLFRKHAAPHVAFGFGVHQCLGQPLARLELEAVFSTLFKRIPTLKLAVPYEELEFKKNVLVHGVHRMPVSW